MSQVKKQKPNLEIVANSETLADKCLEHFIAAADSCIKTKGVFYLAISGGHTPARFFQVLGDDAHAKALSWDKIHVFWVDERYVPQDSPHSNYKLAAEAFLTKVPIPNQNIHPIATNFDDFNAAAKQYENTIRSVFNIKQGQIPKFDLVILGMGADGHTGSLFPNSNAAFDTTDLACVVYLLDQKMPDQVLARITLTHPVILAASRIIVLVSGEEKAKILKEVLESPPDDIRFPIHSLWPALAKMTWLVDSKAAKLL